MLNKSNLSFLFTESKIIFILFTLRKIFFYFIYYVRFIFIYLKCLNTFFLFTVTKTLWFTEQIIAANAKQTFKYNNKEAYVVVPYTGRYFTYAQIAVIVRALPTLY